MMGDQCPTCHSHSTPSSMAGGGLHRRTGLGATDVSLLTAIDGAVGHKMRIWTSQKKELEAQLDAKTKELNNLLAERQQREEAMKREMEEGKRKLEDRLRDLDEQVRTFRAQCEAKIKEEQQRSSKLHQELTREVSQREHELSKAKTRLAESGKTIGILETERVKITSELRETRAQKDSLQMKVKELQRELDSYQSLAHGKKDSNRELEEKFQHRIAEAEKRSSEQERLLNEHINRIEALQKALLLARQVQKQTVEEKRKLDEELAKKDYDVKRLTAELDGTKLALVRLTTEHSTCSCRISDLQKAVNSLKLANTSQTTSVANATDKTAEQKTQIAELRRQVAQLGTKLENARSERNELECRLAESDAAVTRWRETSESLKAEIARLSNKHDHELNDLKAHVAQLESQLKRSVAQEGHLKAQLQHGMSFDINLQHQLENSRKEIDRLRVEISEAHQRIDSLTQERASLFDQLAENGRLRFELEQTRRRLDESVEEAKQYKRLSNELRARRKLKESNSSAPSPAPSMSSSYTITTGKLQQANMPNNAVSLLSAESPTFAAPSSIHSDNTQQHQQQHYNDTVSIGGHTTMVSPAFCQIPLAMPADNDQNVRPPNNRRHLLSTEPNLNHLSCSSPNLASGDDNSRPKSNQSQVTIAETDKNTSRDVSNASFLTSSILAEWERHSAHEAKSLELALSSQLNALTAASEKILSQICSAGK